MLSPLTYGAYFADSETLLTQLRPTTASSASISLILGAEFIICTPIIADQTAALCIFAIPMVG